MNEVEVEIYY